MGSCKIHGSGFFFAFPAWEVELMHLKSKGAVPLSRGQQDGPTIVVGQTCQGDFSLTFIYVTRLRAFVFTCTLDHFQDSFFTLLPYSIILNVVRDPYQERVREVPVLIVVPPLTDARFNCATRVLIWLSAWIIDNREMATSVEKLKTEIQTPVAHSGSKVTIVGVGQVGMACAFSIMTQVKIFNCN